MKTYGGHYLEPSELRDLGIAAVGEDVHVHSTCVMVGLENISFGNHVRIDAFCLLTAGTSGIRLGDYIHIGAYSLLSGGEGIELADFAGLSHGVQIYTRNEDYSGRALTNPTVPARFLKIEKGPVRLRRHVVIGADSIVLPGVEIAEGSVVGALSLIKSSLPAWGIYAGVPARCRGERSRELLNAERELREASDAG